MPKGETHRKSKEWPVDVDNLERTKVTVPPSHFSRERGNEEFCYWAKGIDERGRWFLGAYTD